MLTNPATSSSTEEVDRIMSEVPANALTNNSSDPLKDVSVPLISVGKQHKVISARQTSEIIEKADETVLVLDCRSFIEYNTSHIRKAINVCCSKLMRRRLQQDKMSIKDLLLQSCRVDSDGIGTVVVYDQSTEQPAKLPAESFLVILMSKLLATFNTVYFLRGGFLHFQSHYAHLVESNCPVIPLLTSVTQPAQSHNPDTPPTRVLSFLYLGSQVDAMNKDFIESRRITYVLNVSAHCPQCPHVPETNFLRIPINDTYNEKIVPHLGEAFRFLDKVRESGGCVLVHCLAGISRSPTMAIAYLMHSLRLSYEEAYQYVRERRPTIAPNFNFLGQLLEYEKSINENRHRRHKRQQSYSGTAAGSAAGTSKPMVFVPSSLAGEAATSSLVHQLQQQRIVQILRPHCSALPKRPSLTGLTELAQAASATGADENGKSTTSWSLTLLGESSKLNNISEKQPRLDSPTSAMARLSFDRSISVEVRLPINTGSDRNSCQKMEQVASMSIDIDCKDCATPKSSQGSEASSSSLAALLAKAAVASASAAANLSSLPLRACVVDARLSSALSSAHHRALTCAAVGSMAGGAGGASMPSFDNLLMASFSASSTSSSSSASASHADAAAAAENFAAWRKTRSLDNMAMLDPLIESPDRLSGAGCWSPTTPTATAAPSGHSASSSSGVSVNNTNGVSGPAWVVRAASASLAEQPASSNNKNNNGGGGGLLCSSGTVSPASSSLSIHSVCSSTTEIAA